MDTGIAWTSPHARLIYEHIAEKIKDAETPPVWAMRHPEALRHFKMRALRSTERLKAEAAALYSRFTAPSGHMVAYHAEPVAQLGGGTGMGEGT